MAVLSAVSSFFRSSGKWLLIILGAAAGVLGLLWWREKKRRKRTEVERDAAIAAAKTARAAMRIEVTAAAEQRRIAEDLNAEKLRIKVEADRLRRERDEVRKRIAWATPEGLGEEWNKTFDAENKP